MISIIITITVILLVIAALYYYYYFYDKGQSSMEVVPSVSSENPDTSSIGPVQPSNEVFNLGSNIFSYDEANAVCSAFGASLATFDDMKSAFDKGADWCNYGWSNDQLALYPTQKDSWQKMQRLPHKHRNDCGIPGINGGFFEDKNLRFGVNCYGIRPPQKEIDQMFSRYEKDLIISEEEGPLNEYQRNVNKFKNEKESIIIVPFNHQKWSQSG